MDNQTIEQTIIERARARSDALVNGDALALEQILANEFLYINAQGQMLEKSAYLQAYVTSGTGRFLAQTMDDIRVHVYGEAAVLIGQVHDVFEYQQQRYEADYRSTFVYTLQAGQWRCVAGQTTAITKE